VTNGLNLDTTAASAGADVMRGLWLDTGQHDQLIAALTAAASRTDVTLDCVACAEGTCTDPDHHEPTATFRQWRGLAQKLAALRAGAKPVAVTYHPDAARGWLTEWAADEFGIDESFNTVEVSIVARLENLLRALACNAEPDVWATHPPLECVQLWRTADGDGVDGGAMITADLRFGERTVRIGTRHQGFDDFVNDEATSGIDAAVEALGHVANLVNREVAGLLEATAVRPPAAYTVIGIWANHEPIPVAVIVGDHQVHDGATVFEGGLWTTSVLAADSTTAQQLAVAQMRNS
jgi:hypothetical protein